MTVRRLIGLVVETEAAVRTGDGAKDWTCIECGHGLVNASRPTACPVCNCRTGDLPPRYPLFLRAKSMDAAPGLVTGFRQFRSAKST